MSTGHSHRTALDPYQGDLAPSSRGHFVTFEFFNTRKEPNTSGFSVFQIICDRGDNTHLLYIRSIAVTVADSESTLAGSLDLSEAAS